MENIVEIKNLKKYFKEVKAVDDISFKIKQGELFAFLGLNGAGKSTTINIISGVLKKDSGQVLVCGQDTDTNMDAIKPSLGIVFQHSVLDAKLSVKDNLKYRAALYGIKNEQFNQNLQFLATKLQFSDLLSRPLGKLSGGQKRRIDIARALIHQPKILILDEPTTGLDPVTRMLVWNLINELRATQNLTVLLTTHYMEEAADADYVVIIDSGKIVATGSPTYLKNTYATDFINLYKYDKKLDKIIEASGYPASVVAGHLQLQVPNTAAAKQFILTNEKLIDDFEVIKGKMDNVFLNVTGKQLKEM